jgi:hypothetical protein
MEVPAPVLSGAQAQLHTWFRDRVPTHAHPCSGDCGSTGCSSALRLCAWRQGAALDRATNCWRNPGSGRVHPAFDRSDAARQIVRRYATSKNSRHAWSLFANPQSDLCFRQCHVVGGHPGTASLLVVRTASGVAGFSGISSTSRGTGAARGVRTGIPGLSKTDMVLIFAVPSCACGI